MCRADAAPVAVARPPQVLPRYLTTHTDLLFVRLKPAEQLSPMLTPSEIETKLESKKSQPSQVGTHSDQVISTNYYMFFCRILTN